MQATVNSLHQQQWQRRRRWRQRQQRLDQVRRQSRPCNQLNSAQLTAGREMSPTMMGGRV